MNTEETGRERQHSARAATLLRKLIAVAEGIVVSGHDCGTPQGVIKKAGECDLPGILRGRVSRQDISIVAGEIIVHENELITAAQAREIEKLGIDCVVVRSPLTCLAPQGVCQLCYGADPASGRLVEEGTAVGLLAARTLGEAAARLTVRPFGSEAEAAAPEEVEIRCKKAGRVQFTRLIEVVNDRGERLALSRRGEITVVDPLDRARESFAVANGARLFVTAGQEVQPGTLLCRWDPRRTPILAEVGGRVRFEEIEEGQTLLREDDDEGVARFVARKSVANLYPQILLEDNSGRPLAGYYLPEGAYLEVQAGQTVSAGALLAWVPQKPYRVRDVSSGLPRVVELFEVRQLRDHAVLAELAGRVRVTDQQKRGKRLIYIQREDDGRPTDNEYEHQVPADKDLLVHTGDHVREGDLLVAGPRRLHDILRILGVDALQRYLVDEVQAVYRPQGLEIDDRHIEIIVARMLGCVRVCLAGDTELQPGTLVDKFAFCAANIGYKEWVKVENPGESKFRTGELVRKGPFNEELTRLQAAGKKPPTFRQASPAACVVQLLGISEVLKFRDRQ